MLCPSNNKRNKRYSMGIWYYCASKPFTLPRSQKTRQNSCSTPTRCLDKTVLACDTHDGKARAPVWS